MSKKEQSDSGDAAFRRKEADGMTYFEFDRDESLLKIDEEFNQSFVTDKTNTDKSFSFTVKHPLVG